MNLSTSPAMTILTNKCNIGSLARVGPNDLVTCDPAVLRRMFAVRSTYRRSEWYIGVRFDPVQDSIASIRDEERHLELRAIMAAGVSVLITCILLAFLTRGVSMLEKTTMIWRGP